MHQLGHFSTPWAQHLHFYLASKAPVPRQEDRISYKTGFIEKKSSVHVYVNIYMFKAYFEAIYSLLTYIFSIATAFVFFLVNLTKCLIKYKPIRSGLLALDVLS